jgi:hypothetical protein
MLANLDQERLDKAAQAAELFVVKNLTDDLPNPEQLGVFNRPHGRFFVFP